MKKKLLTVLALITACAVFASCGQSSGGSGNAGGNSSPAAPNNNAAEEHSVNTGNNASETPAKITLTEEYEFTKTVFNQTLEKPVTGYGLKFDEKEDKRYDNALNQERESFHLHIGILETGADMDTHLNKSRDDNNDYAVSVARAFKIEQADAANADGSAKLTVTRYLKYEDDGENDYKYLADLVYTDGRSVVYTEFIYSIDKEYGNGEDVEAEMKAVTGHYGIDYEKLNWTEVKSPSK